MSNGVSCGQLCLTVGNVTISHWVTLPPKAELLFPNNYWALNPWRRVSREREGATWALNWGLWSCLGTGHPYQSQQNLREAHDTWCM